MATTLVNDRGHVVSIDETGARQTAHVYIFGVHADKLTPSQRREVYLLGDGFGDTRTNERRSEMLEYMSHGWDWSHVRDSSAAALVRMLDAIIVYQRHNGRVTRSAV